VDSYAIVIGVDDYGNETANLHGAVDDALAFRDWLGKTLIGGGVPEDNLVLALSSKDAGKQALAAFPGTRDGIISAVNEAVARSGGAGQRLFFYFSGHGINVRENYSDVSAIAGADFSASRPDNSISLRSLWEYFDTLQFADEFFFVDACRNQPWPGEARVGHWPTPRERDLGQAPAQQFRLYATSSGLQAAEIPSAEEGGREGGAFTRTLLRGLTGEAMAKEWNWRAHDQGAYEVRWQKLCRFVRTEMGGLRVRVNAGPAREAFQIPQDENTRGGSEGREDDPVLVTLPRDQFREEQLSVVLEPTAVVGSAEVVVRDDRSRIEKSVRQPAGLPVVFDLAPRRYSVSAEAPEHKTAYADEPVELYVPCTKTLSLEPAEATPAPAPDAPAEGHLVVECSDPLAPLEVADSAGQVLHTGHGELDVPELPAGIYQVRLRTPVGEAVEHVVDVRAGETQTVPLQPPPAAASPALAELVQHTELEVQDDHTLDVSEAAGPIASPRLSTVLALAGAAAVLGDAAPGHRLRELGHKGLSGIPSGTDAVLYVLFGADAKDPAAAAAELERTTVRCWPVGAAVPQTPTALEPFSPAAGIGEVAVPVALGPHWLSVERWGREPLVFAVTTARRRLTMLVLEHGENGENGELGAFQYMPALEADPEHTLQRVRRLELLQRIALGRHIESGTDIAQDLCQAKHADPIAGSLGGYLFLRLGRIDEVAKVAAFLTGEHPGLSDGHVLAAEHHAANDRAREAEEAVRRGVDAGLPVLGEGIVRLLDGIRQFEVEHPYVRLLKQVHEGYAHGSLWSAWTPGRWVPGEQLVP
jgi:Caspase domain